MPLLFCILVGDLAVYSCPQMYCSHTVLCGSVQGVCHMPYGDGKCVHQALFRRECATEFGGGGLVTKPCATLAIP